MNDQPYLYGESSTRVYPLQDYLPEYRPGLVTAWLQDTLGRGSWIISPFGSSPQTAMEAARAGWRVLVPVHNPVLRFLIENLADPPSQEDLQGALATLASSYKGSERVKPFLLSLYETDCPQCGARTSAASFSWSKTSRELVSKTCRCSRCGEECTAGATAEDIQKAAEFSDRSPVYARALTRVTSPADPIRVQVETALTSYLPRTVYALFTVLNKLTGFDLPPEKLADLEILLLQAFYRCSQPLGLAAPGSRERTSSQDTFREENVWLAMEDALTVWAGEGRTVPVTVWPESPPANGGICIFPGRVKDLLPQLEGGPIQGVVAVFPKPTPTFWGLSALWTGWLWGQEAAAPLRGVLSVRSFTWSWMTRAVQTTLTELGSALPGSTPVLGLIPEAGNESLLSGAGAALQAGLRLQNIALDPDQRLVQTRWTLGGRTSRGGSALSPRQLIRQAGFDLLREAGEPRHSLAVYAAGLSRLAEGGYPAREEGSAEEDHFALLARDFEENIAYRQGFLHYPRIESWWHLELGLDPLPQADRVERSLAGLLVEAGEPLSEKDLYQQIYAAFPSLSTPASGLIQACLASYGERVEMGSKGWRIKENDQPDSRVQDLREMKTALEGIGAALGYAVRQAPAPEGSVHLVWEDGGRILDSFFLSASCQLGRILAAANAGDARQWLVLPGSRAGLVHFKLGLNPILAERLKENWGMIKFRHLRRLAEQRDLTRANIQERFLLDPITSDTLQPLLI